MLLNENSSEWSGTEAIRSGNFEKALADILADTIVADSAFRLFKLGCVHQGLENWSKALFYFKMNAQISKKYAPYAYERIGDTELKQRRYESALKAYRVAVNKTDLLPYRYTLYRKMYSIAMKHVSTIGTISWLEEIVGEDTYIPESSMKELFVRLIKSGKSKELGSILHKYVDPSISNDAQCYVCSLLTADPLADTNFSTKTLYLLSKLSYTCKKYKASSDWLHKALDRKDFSKTIPKGQYIYHRAILNYRMRNYNNVLEWAQKYDKLYGSDPTLVYMIARSYRNLGMSTQAAHWYNKHIQLFPYHKRTHDIIWYRAWQEEELNRLESARKFYKTLYKKHKGRSKAVDAYFRYALTYCKEKKFGSALSEFSKFLKKYPSSSLAIGARYWKAKCHFSMRQYKNTRKECQAVIQRAPTNYYAYRARELLFLIGDPFPTLNVNTALSIEGTYQWLDSIAKDSKESFSEKERSTFHLGSCLAAAGMVSHAELVLEPFEISYIDNILLQYELARLYEICNDPTRSFRVAKRLSWRIPVYARSCMPVQIYSILYPRSFSSAITLGAEANNIEAELISSIIRQESIFNPTIVSPAGAIGLMQIMPYTGEEIAKDLKEQFVLDSLYYPSVNIRYGSFYIKKLVNQFKGNLILAIAGYNGGPHNAKKWQAQNSGDGFDMFIEDIGFSETRKYVKKVLGNYWTYSKLKNINAYLKH